MKRKIRAKYSSNLKGVDYISIVNQPAIEEDFFLLSNKLYLELSEMKVEKEKVLVGPILIPDMLIDRGEFDIFFTKEDVKNLQMSFFKNKNNSNINLEHSAEMVNAYVFESWTIEDLEKDKAYKLGLYPVGTWMGKIKIEDDEVWSEYLETGKLKGFSVEVNTEKEEVQLKDEYYDLSEEYLIENDLDTVDIYLIDDNSFIIRDVVSDEDKEVYDIVFKKEKKYIY